MNSEIVEMYPKFQVMRISGDAERGFVIGNRIAKEIQETKLPKFSLQRTSAYGLQELANLNL